jgi:hypothetical protein
VKKTKTISIAVAVVGALAAAPSPASAFCGFYVGSAGETLYNDATQVVLMRSGTRTVLSMQQSYKGPPADFAMVVPVPVVLQKTQVKTLPREVFTHVDKLDAPRLVEYWEQNPCPSFEDLDYGTIGHGSGVGSGFGIGSGRGGMARRETVKVEAKFTVGEYDIVVLSATDALGLEEWLAEHRYKIPPGAAPYLKPYVEGGWKFFVAKVDVDKVKMKDGQAMLSPLRFHYDNDAFTLPIRLGLANSGGVQDLIVHILAPSRYQVANYPNATIPTNLVVKAAARARFGEFYAALFDRTLEENKGAVVTEYAWGSSTCDPCPVSPLSDRDTATLGGDVLGVSATAQSSAPPGPPRITGGEMSAAIVQRYMRRQMPRLAACGLGGLPVVVDFDILASGGTAKVKISGASGGTASCAEKTIDDVEFPKPKGEVHVKFPLTVPAGGGASGLILTRLHARYSADSAGEDLVFREAPPLGGGRGVPDPSGMLPRDDTSAGVSQFQARYVMLNPWTDPIACASPRRGIWGGPPAGREAPPPLPATDLAHAKRGGLDLSAMIADVVAAAPPPATGAATPPPATPPAPVPIERPRRPRRDNGCGTGEATWRAAVILGALLLLRRRRMSRTMR